MIKFVTNYINEVKVLTRQLDYQSTYDDAIRGLIILIGIPIIGILLVGIILIK